MSKFYENFNFSVFWSIFWATICFIVGIYFWETYKIISFILFFIVIIYVFYIVKNNFWKKEMIQRFNEEQVIFNDEKNTKKSSPKRPKNLERDFNDFLINPNFKKLNKNEVTFDELKPTQSWKATRKFKRTNFDLYVAKYKHNKWIAYLIKLDRKKELIIHYKSGQCKSFNGTLGSLQKKIIEL